MKRAALCIFILMAVVAVAFFSLCRVKGLGQEISSGAGNVLHEYKVSGVMPIKEVYALSQRWEKASRSIAYCENKNELDEITRLFAALEASKDIGEFEVNCKVISASISAMVFNETPSLYTIL